MQPRPQFACGYSFLWPAALPIVTNRFFDAGKEVRQSSELSDVSQRLRVTAQNLLAARWILAALRFWLHGVFWLHGGRKVAVHVPSFAGVALDAVNYEVC